MRKKKSNDEVIELVHKYHPELDVLEIEEKGSRTHSRRMKCKCAKCNYIFDKQVEKYKQGCPVCASQKVKVGVNDIATTVPWMVEYFKNKEDAKRFMKHSNLFAEFKCPICGYERMAQVCTVSELGYKCPECRDTESKPNKFIRAVMKYLPFKNIDFEYTSEWTKGKRYDVYFEYQGQSYVIEMDGMQHYQNSAWGDVSKQQKIDRYKDLLAMFNGTFIIRVKCPDGDYQTMINGLLSCELGSVIKKAKVDWKHCIEKAESNRFFEICEYYNQHSGLTPVQIARHFGISRRTARTLLQRGVKLGFCNYEKKPHRTDIDFVANCSKGLKVFDDGKLVGEFSSIKKTANGLSKLYPDMVISYSGLQKAIKRSRDKNIDTINYKGFEIYETSNTL